MNAGEALIQIYETLRGAYGHRGWWPGETPFEIMVGAVLTQRTNWRNVAKAIDALKSAGVMEPAPLSRVDLVRLQSLVRPAGYYRQKAARLKRLVNWLIERTGGDLELMQDAATEDLQEELIALKGIGPETADSILLYALGRPVFVVDAYTKRVTVRHGLIHETCTYFELKELFESNLPRDVELYKDYHAQLVEVGKRQCRTKPRCATCPLHPVLGDPIEAEGF